MSQIPKCNQEHDLRLLRIVAMQGPMEIGYLADHPEFIPAIARWHYDEWSYLRPGETIERRTARLRSCCGHKEIPTVVIALADKELLGTAMLIEYDMDTRMDLTPWLAGVFVSPTHRGRGIGSALCQRIIEEASSLGIKRLYLYTPSAEPFYADRGWTVLDRTTYHGDNVTIMWRDVR